MQSKGKFVFLGLRSFEGTKEKTKGRTFYSANLLQGTETFDVFLDDGQNEFFKDCDLYDSLDLEVNTFIKTDRGMPKLGLRILQVYSITSSKTGEIIDLIMNPNIPSVADISPEVPALKPVESKVKEKVS